jgi:predicted nuclease with TOPRIM domain
MREQLEQRLRQLRSELEAGQKKLAELEAQQSNLRETLSRIQGAIKELEEEIAREDQSTAEQSQLTKPRP